MLTIVNSSSMAMTTSTASRESKPRSEVNDDEAATYGSDAVKMGAGKSSVFSSIMCLFNIDECACSEGQLGTILN